MAQWVKVLASKLKDFSSPRTRLVKERTDSQRLPTHSTRGLQCMRLINKQGSKIFKKKQMKNVLKNFKLVSCLQPH